MCFLVMHLSKFSFFIFFVQNVALLEEEEDINQLTEYFSYEHFYVIYCKFWELDTDHDLYIDQRDLVRHNDHGNLGFLDLSTMMVILVLVL